MKHFVIAVIQLVPMNELDWDDLQYGPAGQYEQVEG